MRIVSLLPSATDIVVALEAGDKLVACTHECDGGPRTTKPLTSNKLGPASSEAEVDMMAGAMASMVHELELRGAITRPWLEMNLGVYRTDLSLLKEARPDVILTEVQGTRGAPEDIRAVESQLERALGKRPKVVHLAASDFEGALRHVAAVAEGIGAAEKGREVEKRMHQRVEAAKGACRGRRRRRVACIQWPDPIYPAGSWVPEMIRMAGGDDVLERQAAASGTVELQEVADARPEIVLMATCGVDRRANEQHARRLAGALPGARRDGVVGDRGGKKARFAACDGVGLLSRTGPQLVDALEMLVELFHPEAQGYGHGGRTFVWT